MSRRRKVITWGLGLLAVSAALAWYALDRCYCYWHDDFRSKAMLHIKSLSTGCEAVSLPEPWRYPNGERVIDRYLPYDERTRERFLDYEFRQSPRAAEEVLFALANRPEFAQPVPPHRTSLQQYAFRFPALSGHPELRIRSLRRVSPAEWDEAAVMPLSYKGLEPEGPYLAFRNDSPIPYAGKSFDRTESYYWPICPALLSPGGRRLAVLSYGPRESKGSDAWDLGPVDWHRYTVDLYRVANGQRIGRIRIWGCHSNGLNDAEWHGDKIFTVPLEQSAQHFIICGLH